MIAVLQRTSRASVTVEEKKIADCGYGLTVLLGVAASDDAEDARLLAEKIAKLRIFTDENGKLNLSVKDIGGDVLVVSNFTLLGSYRNGNRPDFLQSMEPVGANALYETFVSLMRERVAKVQTGIFGADMKLEILNDGPITMVLDSAVLRGPKSR